MATKSSEQRKRGTNVSLRADLVAEARELGIRLSSACEDGLAAAVRAERDKRWQEENRGAIESWNRYIAEHGLPLARFRTF